ncbi:MAG: NADH-quinone oxidoreductase subunit L [Armatimonadetes bacterium]|nr:NADH-quinone oxidoreductase subunit L [Armatimonadota bacterium]
MPDRGWLVPLLPFLSFLVIVFGTYRQARLSGYVSVAGIALSAVCSLALLGKGLLGGVASPAPLTWIQMGGFELQIGILLDPLSLMMISVVSVVASLIQIYSLGYMHDHEYSRFYSYMSLFAFSMLGLVVSANFAQIFIFWELVGLCSFLLIGFYYQKHSAARAAKKAFVVTRFGDLGFVMGIVSLTWLGMKAGVGVSDALSFENLAQFLTQIPADYKQWIPWVALLIFCGAMGKSAQFPLHVWLPDAMEGPTPVSALIHAATMVAAGVYLVARTYPIFHFDPWVLGIVAVVGAITALVAATLALVQTDIKRILAYSTCSQLGYMMLSLGAFGYGAGVFHLMTHAFFKALLFLGSGSVIHALHTNDIWKMGGLYPKMKDTSITFLIGTLALTGFPLLAGFWSKDEILTNLLHTDAPNHMILFGLALLVAVMTSFYMFRLWYLVFSPVRQAPSGTHESGKVMTLPLWILAVFSIVIGFVGTPWANFFGHFIHYGEGGHEAGFSLTVGLLSLAVFATGWYLAKTFYRSTELPYAKILSIPGIRETVALVSTCLTDRFWGIVVRGIVINRIARAAAWIDTNVIDLAVNVVGWTVKGTGFVLRFFQTGKVQTYATYMLAAILIIFFWFFR